MITNHVSIACRSERLEKKPCINLVRHHIWKMQLPSSLKPARAIAPAVRVLSDSNLVTISDQQFALNVEWKTCIIQPVPCLLGSLDVRLSFIVPRFSAASLDPHTRFPSPGPCFPAEPIVSHVLPAIHPMEVDPHLLSSILGVQSLRECVSGPTLPGFLPSRTH